MATIDSTQSGNFSSTSTWSGGVVPVDGDGFNIGVGHTVTIDSGITIPTNGFADSNVYGTLQSQVSVASTLRMNGQLIIQGGGTLHFRAGATFQVNGSRTERHGILLDNEADASVIMEGSDGMPCTTLSSAHNEGSTSLSVASGTNFAAGEWIAIYNNTTTAGDTNDHTYQHEDEGFWIHEVDSNTIYFRIFGGPTHVTIDRVSSSGEKIFVSNAKVFREGQTIIFGTGSNRNVRTISSINYNRNRLTLNSAVTGTVDDETVYLTGSEKYHTNASKVRKIATVTTASASSSATLTVANANMFSAGDDIWIEHRSEADGTTDYAGWYDSGSRGDKYFHTIQSVSSNTITLTAATDYTVVEGALVTRLTRDVICETLDTGGADHAHFYAEHTSSFYSRKLILKDVYFRRWGSNGNNSNVYSCVTVRGYFSTDDLPVTLTETVPARGREPWIEGVALHHYPDNNHRRDWGGLWLYDARYAKARACITMHGDEGFGVHYEPGASIANCIAVANREWGFRLEGSTEWYEWAYLYASRQRYGYRMICNYEQGLGVHDIIADANHYSMYTYNSNLGQFIHRARMTGARYGFVSENTETGFIYSYIKPHLSGYVNVDAQTGSTQAGAYYQSQMYRTGGDNALFSVEHNYEIDGIHCWGYNWEADWDLNENAWRFYRRYDSSSNPGMAERVFIPAGVTVRVSAKVKMAPSFSGTRPYLLAHDMISGTGENRIGANGGADASQWAGKRYYIQFTSAADSAFEEKQVTITSKPYPRWYYIGILSNNSNAAEGFWIRDLSINIDMPYKNRIFNILNNANKFGPVPTQVRKTFTQQKKRLGGRLI